MFYHDLYCLKLNKNWQGIDTEEIKKDANAAVKNEVPTEVKADVSKPIQAKAAEKNTDLKDKKVVEAPKAKTAPKAKKEHLLHMFKESVKKAAVKLCVNNKNTDRKRTPPEIS